MPAQLRFSSPAQHTFEFFPLLMGWTKKKFLIGGHGLGRKGAGS
jgi:hypothetical protein